MAGIPVARWIAADHNYETGKVLEYIITQYNTQRGGQFYTWEIFKPFQLKSGQDVGKWIKGRGVSLTKSSIVEFIDKMNHMLATAHQHGFLKDKIVVQIAPEGPAAVSVQQPPAPQQQVVAQAPQVQPNGQQVVTQPQQPAYTPPPAGVDPYGS